MTDSKENENQGQEVEMEHEHVHGPHCNHGHHHGHATAPLVRAAPKVGRNDPCPCGSKNKFKKCCGK